MGLPFVLALATLHLAAADAAALDAAAVCSSGSCADRTTRGSVLLQSHSVLGHVSNLDLSAELGHAGSLDLGAELNESAITCDESSWPDKDNGLVCGECKVLVNHFSSVYKTCRGYCEKVGRQCVGAWEEQGDTCDVLHDMTCDETISSSDAICQCGAELPATGGSTCYGELTHLALDEGSTVGAKIPTKSAAECQSSCTANDQCQSFSLCPEWTGCWMKDRSLTGDEATRVHGRCKSYYKKPCTSGPAVPTPASTPAPVQAPAPSPAPMPAPPAQTPAPSPAPTPVPPAPTPAPPVTGAATCYGELTHLAVDEGNTVGAKIPTKSAAECQSSCTANDQCQSFSLCPKWTGCWMKDRSLAGNEATQVRGSCKSYYKKPCSSSPAMPTPASTPTPSPPATGAPPLKVMSYNTVYSGYPQRVDQFGAKIREVGAGVVGTQECQDKNALASASGYQLVPGTDFQNPIFYDPGQVTLVQGSSGWTKLPRDNYATRTLTWAKFRLGSSEFWFFNTHLPHNHGMAASSNTHSRIARTLLEKREELGAGNAPTVVVGDMNPFASNGASEGSFESTLKAAGFEKSYQGRGNPGFGGLDKIFSSSHWQSSNGADHGTGTSDHPAIAVDLVLQR